MKQQDTTLRKTKRVRKKLRAISDRPRLTVFRSNKHIYAQVIDDRTGQTLVTAHEKELAEKAVGTKTEKAVALGRLLAEKAVAAKVTKVAFDKGPYKYHGRVKALADGAREKGLEF
jgi:large subunit ribosomal protein L18